jgi:hypothetical protein
MKFRNNGGPTQLPCNGNVEMKHEMKCQSSFKTKSIMKTETKMFLIYKTSKINTTVILTVVIDLFMFTIK